MKSLYRTFTPMNFWVVHSEMVFSGIFQSVTHESLVKHKICGSLGPTQVLLNRISGVGFGIHILARSQVALVHIKVVNLLNFAVLSKFSKTLLPIFALAMFLWGQDSLTWTSTPFHCVVKKWNHGIERVWFPLRHNHRLVRLCGPLLAASFYVGGEQSES